MRLKLLRETLNIEDIKLILHAIADTLIEKKDFLTKLDAECGDGDFGVGMYIGFTNVKKSIDEYKDKDVGLLLKKVGQSILTLVGGSSGPLFSTIFSGMGEKAEGKKEIRLQVLAEMLDNALKKVSHLSGAKVGDKTLIDALGPAVRVIVDASEKGLSLEEALKNAAQAAKHGAESTKNLVARKGRARYLGEATLGHQDPGATAIYFIFKSIFDAYKSLK